jgi:hypothetical protein
MNARTLHFFSMLYESVKIKIKIDDILLIHADAQEKYFRAIVLMKYRELVVGFIIFSAIKLHGSD